ncbi:MAG: hypothetical protein R3Y09_08020 [Clostridia bacterium]
MAFFENLLVSITVVAIFSAIVLNIVDEKNPQREIVKISCGLLMIVVLLNGLNNGFMLDFEEYQNFYTEYEDISNQATLTYSNIEMVAVQQDLENLILSEIGINCNVYFNENYEISCVEISDANRISELTEFLGISEDCIEYIESR